MSDEIVYTSKATIERVRGPIRRAHLPHTAEPVMFGVHSEIAEHYGVDPALFEPTAATLDYVVAAPDAVHEQIDPGLCGGCCRRLTDRDLRRRAGSAQDSRW